MWDLLNPYLHVFLLLSIRRASIISTVLAGSHLGGTCHPQWPEDEPGCRSAFRCFRLLIQYDLLWFTVLTNDLQRQQCCSRMPQPSWHVLLSSISWRLGRCPWGQENNQASNGHVSYCYTAQAMLIVVLFLWTKQTKHEPQIVALSMIDPTSMNHVDSVLPYIEFGLWLLDRNPDILDYTAWLHISGPAVEHLKSKLPRQWGHVALRLSCILLLI